MLISGLNSYLYTGIISITEMGIKLWSVDHAAFVDYGVRARDLMHSMHVGCRSVAHQAYRFKTVILV